MITVNQKWKKSRGRSSWISPTSHQRWVNLDPNNRAVAEAEIHRTRLWQAGWCGVDHRQPKPRAEREARYVVAMYAYLHGSWTVLFVFSTSINLKYTDILYIVFTTLIASTHSTRTCTEQVLCPCDPTTQEDLGCAKRTREAMYNLEINTPPITFEINVLLCCESVLSIMIIEAAVVLGSLFFSNSRFQPLPRWPTLVLCAVCQNGWCLSTLLL